MECDIRELIECEDWSEADLREVNLNKEDFRGKNLSQAKLQRANLNGANFHGVKRVGAQLMGANGNIDLVWLGGFTLIQALDQASDARVIAQHDIDKVFRTIFIGNRKNLTLLLEGELPNFWQSEDPEILLAYSTSSLLMRLSPYFLTGCLSSYLLQALKKMVPNLLLRLN